MNTNKNFRLPLSSRFAFTNKFIESLNDKQIKKIKRIIQNETVKCSKKNNHL
jgi:hypothetical protein